MEKKKSKKKPKIKTYIVLGYYLDGNGVYTIVQDPKNTNKTKKIKGIV
jgi:hypothetical protein